MDMDLFELSGYKKIHQVILAFQLLRIYSCHHPRALGRDWHEQCNGYNHTNLYTQLHPTLRIKAVGMIYSYAILMPKDMMVRILLWI